MFLAMPEALKKYVAFSRPAGGPDLSLHNVLHGGFTRDSLRPSIFGKFLKIFGEFPPFLGKGASI